MLTKTIRTKDVDMDEAKASHAWFYGPGERPEPALEIPRRWRNGEGSIADGWRKIIERNGEATFHVRHRGELMTLRLYGVRMRVGGRLGSYPLALQLATPEAVENLRAFLASAAL